MVSLRGRLFNGAMRFFFKYVVPKDLPIKEMRAAAESQPFFDKLSPDFRCEERIIGGVAGEWIVPPNARTDTVLLYLHGGGYVLKTPAAHRVLAGRLAQAAACPAFMADYRLAPDDPFPAAVDDAMAVYHGLIDAGYSPSKITVAGDSAGGGLTAALLLSLRDAGDALPAAACLISAMLDCTFSDASIPELEKLDPYLRLSDLTTFARCYYGDHDPRHPWISPVYADLRGLPPLLVMAGTHEILRTDSERLADNAQKAGVDVRLSMWEGMMHAFPVFARMLPEGKTAIQEIGAFLKRHTGA